MARRPTCAVYEESWRITDSLVDSFVRVDWFLGHESRLLLPAATFAATSAHTMSLVLLLAFSFQGDVYGFPSFFVLFGEIRLQHFGFTPLQQVFFFIHEIYQRAAKPVLADVSSVLL